MRSEKFPLSVLTTSFSFLLFLFITISAPAQNLVPNPDFNGGMGTTGWSSSAGLVWSAQDYRGAAASGSAELQAGALVSVDLVSSCFPVTGGRRYLGSFWHRWESITTLGYAAIKRGSSASTVEMFSDGACADAIGGPSFFLGQGSLAWRQSTFVTQVPANAASARLNVVFTGLVNLAIANYDGFFFGDTGAAALFDDGFEAGDTGAWSLTFVGS